MNRRAAYLSVSLIASASLAWASIAAFPTALIYNPSPSAPIGFYGLRKHEELAKGDFVAALPENNVMKLAFSRGYLPAGAPVLKTVFGVRGDEICIENNSIFIGKTSIVDIQKTDSLGRPMPITAGCFILQDGEYFLLSTAIKNSFDSRYFGPVDEDNILGVATPLLIFSK